MRCMTTLGIFLGMIVTAIADEPASKHDKPSIKEIKLTLHPMKVGRRALEHRLLPQWLDRTDANAAPIYYRCVVLLEGEQGARPGKKVWDDVKHWLKSPVGELPQDDVRKTLGQFGSVLGEAEVASRRSYCRWELSIRERQEDLFGILLPEIQGLIRTGRLLALRARLEIAEGKYNDAILTLQTGYAMSRHVAEQPFIVNSLVGMRIADLMNDQVLAFITSSESPNLYWPLSALPQPLIELRGSLDLEAVGVYLVFPQLLAAKNKKLTAGQWNAELDRFLGKLDRSVGLMAGSDFKVDLSKQKDRLSRDRILAQLDKARAGLISYGYPKKEIRAMSAGQAILLYTALTYDELRDDLYKWFYVPYSQARDGIAAARRRFDTEGKDREIIPIAGLILSAVGDFPRFAARGRSRVEMLRIIEAIRIYAAEHKGKLPSSLSDIKNLPIPLNSLTGKAFGYRVDGDYAILEAVGTGDSSHIRYHLQIFK